MPVKEHSPLPPAHRARTLVAVVACIAIYGVTASLSLPLVSLVLVAADTSPVVIGAMGAVPSLAMLAFAPAVPWSMRRFGVRRFLLACIVLEAALFVLLPLLTHLAAWFVIRFLMGATVVGLFVGSESWINEVADDRIRGRVLGLYNSVLAAAFAVGPAVLAVTGTQGWQPFVIASVIILVAGVPLLHARLMEPRFDGTAAFGLLRFARIAPVVAGAVFLVALLDTALLALLPVYGLRHGLQEGGAALLLTALAVGGISLQYPLGWLLDHVDRHGVLVACAVATVSGAILLPVLVGQGAWLWLMMFAWGGVLLGIYVAAMAIVGQEFRGADLAVANAAFGFAWGLGSLAGPAMGGAAMGRWGPEGLPLVLACAGAVFVGGAFLARRPGRRSPGR